MQVQEEEVSAGVGGDAQDTVFGEAMADKFNVNIRDDLSEVCMDASATRIDPIAKTRVECRLQGNIDGSLLGEGDDSEVRTCIQVSMDDSVLGEGDEEDGGYGECRQCGLGMTFRKPDGQGGVEVKRVKPGGGAQVCSSLAYHSLALAS